MCPPIFPRLFNNNQEPSEDDASQEDSGSSQSIEEIESTDETAVAKARSYLEQVRQKMERLAEDFAAGRVNTTQFQELYAHYQQERKAIEEILNESPEAAAWHVAAAQEEGESVIIRRRHAARILGYAIYLSDSTTPLRSVGQYNIEHRLLASMLDNFRTSAQSEKGQIYSIEVEETGWVGFIAGKQTTLAVLFSVEPARGQLDMLKDLQSHFEQANKQALARGIEDASQYVFPHAVVFE